MANICRSPTVEAIFHKQVKISGLSPKIFMSSAGTIGKYSDRPADKGATKTAYKHGYNLNDHLARKVNATDFTAFDYIVAVDNYNLLELQERCPVINHKKLHLLLDFVPELKGRDVPDPYKRSRKHYEQALQLLEVGSRGLLQHIRKSHSL